MIYCTMSIGKYHSEKYSNDINRLATKYKVEVLTDCPEYFKNCTIHEYSRDVFSYYEKLPFMLSVILNNKDRVLYFDSDTIIPESFVNISSAFSLPYLIKYVLIGYSLYV